MAFRSSHLRRALLPLLGLLVSATAVTAQAPRRILHRPIPGDVSLDSEDHTRPLPVPATREAVSRSAGENTGWRSNQPVDPTVLRPRAPWEAPARDMDRETRSPRDARLRYREVFTPEITPFKRTQSYDMIDEQGRMTIRDPSLRPLRVGEDVPERWGHSPRARFVGEVIVELSPSWPTPIPSVAGDQSIVSYTTSNDQSVEFAQDSAGNLYVRGAEPGVVRLTYVVEAPESAFHAPAIPSVSLARASAELPASLRPLPPSWLASRAAPVLAQAGVTQNDTLDVALARLVEYFRSFRDAELADQQNPDTYTTLALGRVGACRHRSYGLMPTLLSLGIPARYVGNEAHAWVEAFVTRVGWTRLDLGGWDVPLDASAPSERPHFRPANADPFPRTQTYQRMYSARGESGAVRTRASTDPNDANPSEGNRNTAATEVPSPAAPNNMQNTPGPNANGTIGSGGGSASGTGSGESGTFSTGHGGSGGTRGTPASNTHVELQTAHSATAAREPTHTPALDEENEGETLARVNLSVGTVRADESAGFAAGRGYVRGSMMLVEGEARDERGNAVGGLAVEVRLQRNGRLAESLGSTVTRADGRWEARVLLPVGLEAGDYDLVVFFPGDRLHAASTGE